MNAASAVCRRCIGDCTGGCGRAGKVVCGGCGFAGLWRFPEEEAALGNHCQRVSGQPLSIPWGTARSNTASAVCSRYGGACAGGCCRAGRVVCGSCGFAGLWRFPEKEAALGNHSTTNMQGVKNVRSLIFRSKLKTQKSRARSKKYRHPCLYFSSPLSVFCRVQKCRSK